MKRVRIIVQKKVVMATTTQYEIDKYWHAHHATTFYRSPVEWYAWGGACYGHAGSMAVGQVAAVPVTRQ